MSLSSLMRGKIVIAVHGGAGRRKPRPVRLAWIESALEAGYRILAAGGSALDAVEAAIRTMESSGAFNAGRGAVRQEDGRRRMDAALMEGAHLRTGAVTGVRSARSPVALARAVMEKTPHVLMDGEAARKRFQAPRGRGRRAGKKEGSDTVGAVAMDRRGNVAAGTSTGGAPPMLPGRIGIRPWPGADSADNSKGAVSATGKGESIIRASLAADIIFRMGSGQSPAAASRAALRRMRARAGGIARRPGDDKKGRGVPVVPLRIGCPQIRRPVRPAKVGVRFQRPCRVSPFAFLPFMIAFRPAGAVHFSSRSAAESGGTRRCLQLLRKLTLGRGHLVRRFEKGSREL